MVSRMAAENLINGSYGELRWNGQELANVRSIEYTITLDREEVMIAGTRNKQYKAMSSSGTGTLVIYKVTSLFVPQMVRAFSASSVDNSHALAAPTGVDAGDAIDEGYWMGNTNLGQAPGQGMTLQVTLDDPEQYNGESESITLQNVKLWSINGGFSVGDMLEQNIDFTFELFDSAEEISAP